MESEYRCTLLTKEWRAEVTLNRSRDNNKQAQSSLQGSETCRSGATRDLEQDVYKRQDNRLRFRLGLSLCKQCNIDEHLQINKKKNQQ